jgi:hypothetical protein
MDSEEITEISEAMNSVGTQSKLTTAEIDP